MASNAARLARTAANRIISRSGGGAPVRSLGALTSKPYAFQVRSWELKSVESVDVFDGVGSNIRIDTRGSEIKRILPRLNEQVNEEWLSDKARFSYDGLKRQRLSTPMVLSPHGTLLSVDWHRARTILLNQLLALQRANPDGFESHAIIGPYVDVAAGLELRNQFYRWFPAGQIHVQECPKDVPVDFTHSYRCNTTLQDLELADVVLLVGSDPRQEAPLLNTRLRKAALYGGLTVGCVGTAADQTYPVDHLGNTLSTLAEIAEGTHPFAATLAAASRPIVLVSNKALQREDGAGVYALCERVVASCGGADADWDALCVLQNGANTVGLLDIGFNDKYAGLRASDSGSWDNTKFMYLLGADDFDVSKLPSDCFVVYQGHHGDRGASSANLVLPGAAYTEKSATYVNTEGRVQNSKLAFFPPGLAEDDASVLRNILGADEALGKAAYDLGNNPMLRDIAPHLCTENQIQKADRILGDHSVLPETQAAVFDTPLQPPIDNYYMTDPITRSSKTMAKCTQVRAQQVSNFL